MPRPAPIAKTNQAKARKAYAEVPRRTVADDPGRYTKTPHDYGDVLIKPDAKGRTKLGGAIQRDLVYWIERHTWGDSKRPEYAKLSLTQLAKLCGSDRRTIARNVADLVARNIIEARDRTGCGPNIAKMYKLTPEKWKAAPYYEPPAVDDAEEVTEEEPETAELEAQPEAETGPYCDVEPGKVSKPQPIAVSPAKGAPPVTIRMVYRSENLPFPVAFSSRPGRNGRIQISCRATALHRFASCSPVVSPVSVDQTRLNDFTTFLQSFVLENWGKAADQALIESIVSASGTAPLWLFEAQVREKFKQRGAAKRHTTGLLIELAKDAARAQQIREQADRNAAEARKQGATDYSPAVQECPEQTPKLPACSKCQGTGHGKPTWKNIAGVYGPRPTTCKECNGTGEATL